VKLVTSTTDNKNEGVRESNNEADKEKRMLLELNQSLVDKLDEIVILT
jgi:hypothetical protein